MGDFSDTDPLEKFVNQWIPFSERARKEILEQSGISLGNLEFNGLARRALKLDCLTLLVNVPLPTVEEFLSLIDLPSSGSEVVEEVFLDESILNQDLPSTVLEETIKITGEIWRIHKNDMDPFPSSPHAHNLQSGLKLDLRNGYLYDKKNMKGQISRKDLELIRSKVKKIPLPPLDSN